jgi:hypothetical protein
MSNEQEQVKMPRESTHQPFGVSEARRQWVKGGVWAAPVLLTLPRMSSAAASNQHCVELKAAGLTEAQAINPGGTYIAVSRPAYTLDNDVTVVYDGFDYPNPMPDPCTSGNWRDISSWASIYTPDPCPNPTQFSPTGGGGPYNVTGSGSVNVIVQVSSTGTPVAIGPTGSQTYVITTSCWTSALPGNAPQ